MKGNSRRIFLILIIFSVNLIPVVFANDDDSYGWEPRFYEGSYQEERNVCLGIIIADKSQPGLESPYSVGGYIYGTDESWPLFENRYFKKEDAFATITSKFKTENGENHLLYLYIVSDECLADKERMVNYQLYDRDFPNDFPNDYQYIAGINIFYKPTNEECNEDMSSVCTSMDLTEFYSWEAEEDDDTIDDDDDNDENNDNDMTDDDDKSEDDKKNDQCGGCDLTGGKLSFPLTLFMILVGTIAWRITRKT